MKIGIRAHGYRIPSTFTYPKLQEISATNTNMEDYSAQVQGMGEESPTNLIINYLPQILSDEEFRSIFNSIGPIKSAKIIRDKVTGYSSGFGFIDYERAQDADRAIQALNGLQVQHKTIKVSKSRSGGENIKGANLYVSRLPIPWTETELSSLFEPYGKIIQSKILVDLQTGVSKRVGFVLYSTRGEAETAINSLNGTTPSGCTEPLLIKFANDKSRKMEPPVVQYVPVPMFAGQGQGPVSSHSPGPMRSQGGRFRFNPMTANYNMQNNSPMSGSYNVQNSGQVSVLFFPLLFFCGRRLDGALLWRIFD